MKCISCIIGIFIFLFLVSCEDKGPKGHVYVDDKSVDEIVDDVIDAQEGDGWVYMYDVDLHKKIDGTWEHAGKFSIYSNLADKDDDCNLWVEFDGPTGRMPVETTDKAGYRFRSQYMGEFYYF